MQLSETQLKEFRDLWKDNFGEEISDKEARDKARNILQLVREVYSFNN